MKTVRHLAALGCFLVAYAVFGTFHAAAEKPTITLITTDQGSARVMGEGPHLDPRRPGWMIELFRLVADRAGVTFEFQRTAWKDALRRVQDGKADAAFNASFKPSRAVYGVYPMRDGELDYDRATLNYTYWLYYRKDTPVSWNGMAFTGLKKPIGAERSAAIVSVLEKRGADVLEIQGYDRILKSLTDGKTDGIAGFEGNVEAFLQADPQRFGGVMRHPVPLLRSSGFLMFSKHFYAAEPQLAERIWDAIGAVWSTPRAAEIRRSYE